MAAIIQIASRKGSSTPSLRDVYFITPDGEEIKSRKALDKYLKSHPGGLTASDFDWSTGIFQIYQRRESEFPFF